MMPTTTMTPLVFQRGVADCHHDLEGVGLLVACSGYNVISALLRSLDGSGVLLCELTVGNCGSVHNLLPFLIRSYELFSIF